jgi:Domain of unknown function (DUF6430)
MEIWKDVQTWRFWRHLAIHTFSAVGFFVVILGLFDVLFPGVISRRRGWLTVCVVVASAVYGIYRAWPRPIEQDYSSPNTKIRLVKGDLFDQPGHLVIGMSNTFDTLTPHIIAKSSIQGQFLERIYDGDVKELDRQLTLALRSISPMGAIEKPGKKNQYSIGTIATLQEHARRFFCLAYTEMNVKNEARGTVDGIWRSLDSLWKEISIQANGGRVSIPVIGGGQSRLSQILPAQDSIRFIALSFILASRREKVCDELAIVVRSREFEKLDRLEIQSFLRSLRPS